MSGSSWSCAMFVLHPSDGDTAARVASAPGDTGVLSASCRLYVTDLGAVGMYENECGRRRMQCSLLGGPARVRPDLCCAAAPECLC